MRGVQSSIFTTAVIQGPQEALDRLRKGLTEAAEDSAAELDFSYAKPRYIHGVDEPLGRVMDLLFSFLPGELHLGYFAHDDDFASYDYLEDELGCRVRAVRLPDEVRLTYPTLYRKRHEGITLTLTHDEKPRRKGSFTDRQQWVIWREAMEKRLGPEEFRIELSNYSWSATFA